MKIKSIKLHNFMRYKGDNELVFSTDSEKNVTVVLGDNTFGKTTLAQAFRWGLYESLNDTSYSKKKDVVLLNNEAAAELIGSQMADVYVEITVINEAEEYKFIRKARFNKKNAIPSDISVKQIGEVQLTMQIKSNGIWGDVINNTGNNPGKKEYKNGCVQETIDNMLPQSLSNYFFFDGERWNDLKSKTSDIKKSVDTILGVSGLIEMKKHLKDSSYSVTKRLRDRLQGSNGEYDRLKREIKDLEEVIQKYDEDIESTQNAIETVQRLIESTQKTLDDNRKIEEDQKELKQIEKDIENYERFRETYYADVIKEFSNSAKYFTATLLPEFEEILNKIDLEGKDIPGVTVDTLNYLLELGECLCGTKLDKDSAAYENMLKLKKQVPPEMIGGAAGKLKNTLEAWKSETSELEDDLLKKAEAYDQVQDNIDDLSDKKSNLERIVDRKTNLGPVREQNRTAKQKLRGLLEQKANFNVRKERAEQNIKSKESQLDEVAKHDRQNAMVYRCLAYVDALYDKASMLANQKKCTTITDLNEIIGENFQRMFNDHEKYAKLSDDYKIEVFYRKIGDIEGKKEEVLSNGETIALNFVFVVSILELAKKYRELEIEDEDYGMENAILGLPLVLDAPFSALSNDNTSLVANRLPQFAEQVIIFMLDKDWEASGLDKYTLPEYCYRVNKEATSNSSSLEKN